MATTVRPDVRATDPVGRTRVPARLPSVGRNLWWFVLPALGFYLFVVLVPTVQGVYASFTDWSAFSRSRQFVGFKNYADAFQGDLGAAALRTVLLAVVTMIVQNVLGLLLALALHQRVVGRNLLRTLIFAPVVVSPLVCGFLFKYIFGAPDSGAINKVFDLLGLSQVDFLGQPRSALAVIVIVVCWQFTGAAMVIYLAGLQGIPQEIMEAAGIDGAGPLQRFWYVVRPLLAPAFTINLMLGLIGGLKIFDQIFAITQGGPAGSTHTISTLIYQLFSQFGFWARSTALAVLLAVAVSVLSLVQFTVLRRQENRA
jgi:raffinose/stachyose/melibiose transport system permease protein